MSYEHRLELCSLIWAIYIYIYVYREREREREREKECVLLHLNKQTNIMSQIVPDKRRMGDCRGRSELNFQIADKSTKSFKT